MVAPDFVAAGKAHGREFVVGLMKDHYGAAMYDKVPVTKLSEFQALLKAGPQAKEDPNSVADLMA